MESQRIPVEIETALCVRGWWSPLAIAVVLIIITNATLLSLGVRHTPRHEEYLLQAKWSLASDSSHSFDWIVVGDSSGTFGVDPSILSKRLSGSCVNLCTFGSMGVIGDVWIIDEYLKHHSPPRGVIVVHAADVWSGQQSDALFQYAAAVPESTLTLLTRTLSLGARPSELFVLLRNRDYFPLLTLKDRLRGGVGWSSDDAEAAAAPMSLPNDGTWRLETKDANPDHVTEESQTYLSEVAENSSLCRHHRIALRRLMDRAHNEGFDVYLANGPIATTVRDSTKFGERMGPIAVELSAIATRVPRVSYVLPDWAAFPPAEMENCNHVVGPAVDAYTHALADAILDSRRHDDSENQGNESSEHAFKPLE